MIAQEKEDLRDCADKTLDFFLDFGFFLCLIVGYVMAFFIARKAGDNLDVIDNLSAAVILMIPLSPAVVVVMALLFFSLFLLLKTILIVKSWF